MSYPVISKGWSKPLGLGGDLFERFVIDEAGSILGDLQLPLLEMFTELPGRQNITSGGRFCVRLDYDEETVQFENQVTRKTYMMTR